MVSRVLDLKNIKDESTETNYPSNILNKCCVNDSKMLPTFSQNLTVQEAFETVAQINAQKERNSMVYFEKNSNF